MHYLSRCSVSLFSKESPPASSVPLPLSERCNLPTPNACPTRRAGVRQALTSYIRTAISLHVKLHARDLARPPPPAAQQTSPASNCAHFRLQGARPAAGSNRRTGATSLTLQAREAPSAGVAPVHVRARWGSRHLTRGFILGHHPVIRPRREANTRGRHLGLCAAVTCAVLE